MLQLFQCHFTTGKDSNVDDDNDLVLSHVCDSGVTIAMDVSQAIAVTVMQLCCYNTANAINVVVGVVCLYTTATIRTTGVLLDIFSE